MTVKELHQVVETVLENDATSDHIFVMRRWLREMGFVSDIYSLYRQPKFNNEVRNFSPAAFPKNACVVFHHANGSTALDQIWDHRIPLLLIYHNITPPEFFVGTADPVLIRMLEHGREQLEKIPPITRLALADSDYSEMELRSFNFKETGVLPIVLDEKQYDHSLDLELQAECRANGPLLLFVGRLVPNKRQEDLIKFLYFYRRIEPDARLVLVGSLQLKDYVSWLHHFARTLGLEDAVIFTGRVTQQEMVTYYKSADLYVSMSEHEGFGKPLIESMYLGLPVLAYASSAVPSTLGGAGVLFSRKDYEGVAEIADILIKDKELRSRVLNAQKQRVQTFLEPSVRQRWQDYLKELGLL